MFSKFASSLIGPTDSVAGADISERLDFEGELGIVMGRSCRHVKAEEALSFVAGVTVVNDISARDLQFQGTQWLPGKAIDQSTPCGPALVTLDEGIDVQNLALKTFVNGIEMQSSSTQRQIFTVGEVVAYVSTFLELQPGDVIATGTPEGVGSKRTPPTRLTRGDVVEVTVEGIGSLRNVVH